jgi:hypothetical protein
MSYSSNTSIAPQGSPEYHNGMYYQTFVMVDWLPLPDGFSIGDRFELIRIDTDKDDLNVSISDDNITSRMNGSFYVSLAGVDNTGRIVNNVLGEEESELDAQTLRIYPNPSIDGKIFLDVRNLESGQYQYSVYDLPGSLLLRSEFEFGPGGTLHVPIECSHLGSGHYFLSVKGMGVSRTFKFIIIN